MPADFYNWPRTITNQIGSPQTEQRDAYSMTTPTTEHALGHLPVSAGVEARGKSSWRGDVATALAALGLGACAAMAWMAVKGNMGVPGGWYTILGTMTAMTGTYLSLVMLVLAGRIPWIEREVGHDRLIAFHRNLSPYPLVLIFAHVLFTTLGYATQFQQGWYAETMSLITQGSWMLPAAAAFVLMIFMGVISYRKIRARMRYETWWVMHLYFYLAIVLAFGHQVEMGTMFSTNALQKWFWTFLYAGSFVLVVASRVITPLIFSFRHRLHVADVRHEANGVVSVYITGRDLDMVKARGGQFFQWRFITRHGWWQSHPYSLSAAPNRSWLRVTVKELGDHSATMRELKVGTKVIAEGPYGVFTAAARHSDKVAAFAAGVGITPIRAVLEDMPATVDVVVVYRAADAANAPLRLEIQQLCERHGWELHYLEGPRDRFRLDSNTISAQIPDLSERDVFVCGPTQFSEAVMTAAHDAGVAQGRVHHEEFEF